MGMDVCWKEYFWDDARYADVINGIGCRGQQLVHAGDLQDWIPRSGTGTWERPERYVSGIWYVRWRLV